MRHTAQLLATAIAATTILALAVTGATAGRLSVTNKQFRAVWSSLELTNNVTSGTTKCPVTLEGSFHSATIRKVARALIGYITRAFVSNTVCTGGRATINQETLPWHLTYESFSGTLPEIRSVTFLLIRASFILNPNEGNGCRATTTLENPAADIASIGANGQITGIRADETRGIPLVNGPGGVFCGLGTGRFSGTGAVTQLGTSTPVSIRLI